MKCQVVPQEHESKLPRDSLFDALECRALVTGIAWGEFVQLVTFAVSIFCQEERTWHRHYSVNLLRYAFLLVSFPMSISYRQLKCDERYIFRLGMVYMMGWVVGSFAECAVVNYVMFGLPPWTANALTWTSSLVLTGLTLGYGFVRWRESSSSPSCAQAAQEEDYVGKNEALIIAIL
jgi:uncharacterized membrane protein YhdT